MGVTLEQGNAIRDFISNKNVCLEANYGSGKDNDNHARLQPNHQ
jgi:hypothetical protein